MIEKIMIPILLMLISSLITFFVTTTAKAKDTHTTIEEALDSHMKTKHEKPMTDVINTAIAGHIANCGACKDIIEIKEIVKTQGRQMARIEKVVVMLATKSGIPVENLGML